jgi:hypothetical protein
MLSNGEFSVAKSHYQNATSTFKINIYSDEGCTKIIDKLSITVLKDGSGMYILYHDALSGGGKPSKPTGSYFSYPNDRTDAGWYRV